MDKCKEAGIKATGEMKGAMKVANIGDSEPGGTGNYNTQAKMSQVDSKAVPHGTGNYNSERGGK